MNNVYDAINLISKLSADERKIIANQIKPQTTNKDYTLRVRMTETERQELQQLADQAGQTLSDYVRQRIFQGAG